MDIHFGSLAIVMEGIVIQLELTHLPCTPVPALVGS